MIGLAVGIDYSLFIVTKHRAQVAEGMVHESIARALATAGGAVLFAGGTVAISLPALVVAGIPLVTTLGYTSAIAVAFAILGRSPCCRPCSGCLDRTSRRSSCRSARLARRGAVPTLDEVGHGDRESPLAGDDRCAGDPAGALDTHAVDAPRPGGRRGRADRHDRSPGLRPDHEGFGAGTNGPFLISTQLSKPAKPDQKNLNTISQNEKQLQQQQQQIEQQAELEGATQQQAEQEAKQQTQKQSNELANKKKKAEQPATDPRLRPCARTSRRPRASSRRSRWSTRRRRSTR